MPTEHHTPARTPRASACETMSAKSGPGIIAKASTASRKTGRIEGSSMGEPTLRRRDDLELLAHSGHARARLPADALTLSGEESPVSVFPVAQTLVAF